MVRISDEFKPGQDVPNSGIYKVLESTIQVSACEGRIPHKGKESSSRKLVWVEGQTFAGSVALNARGSLTFLAPSPANH